MVAKRQEPESMTNQRNPRKTILYLVIVAFVLCLYAIPRIWTAPLGVLWHIRHGTFVEFEHQQIRVPWDMWVITSGDHALTILRQTPEFPVLNSPSGVILISRGSGAPTDFSKNFAKIAAAYERNLAGFHTLGLRKLSAKTGAVFCWEQGNVGLSELDISCLFDNSTLSAAYSGSPRYRDAFYNVLKKMCLTSGEEPARRDR